MAPLGIHTFARVSNSASFEVNRSGSSAIPLPMQQIMFTSALAVFLLGEVSAHAEAVPGVCRDAASEQFEARALKLRSIERNYVASYRAVYNSRLDKCFSLETYRTIPEPGAQQYKLEIIVDVRAYAVYGAHDPNRCQVSAR